MEYVYAFDLSMSCVGLTIFSNDGKPVLVTSIDTAKQKNHAEKLKFIADKVLEYREIYDPEKVVIEGAFTRFNTSTQVLYRCHGLINYLFWDKEQIYYQPMTVKKLIGGKGNMKKNEIQQAILNKYPEMKFKNDDESDSFALGLCYFIKEKGMKL